MISPAGRRLRILGSALSVLVLLAGLAFCWFYFELRSSLPQLDGSATLAGLGAPVTVTRDALGVPTVKAVSRMDAARALGYLHAQDRFFQMDLLRRRGAGELSELFGNVALNADRTTRRHGFRALAKKVLDGLPPGDRALLTSYTAGVNAGLAALKEKPFEYLVLRVTPEPWRPEDSMLIIYAMTLDLQDSTGSYELSLATARDQLGNAGLAFFAPLLGPDDAALDGSTAPLAPIPAANVINVRNPEKVAHATRLSVHPLFAATSVPEPDLLPGSNCFALAGIHTATGAGLLANDPHLDLSVPNLWYRAEVEWREPVAGHLVGVTIPGMPFVVIGSNGHIAWGLTNGFVDTGDLVTVPVNTIDRSLYRAPGHVELVPIEKHSDVIRVKGGDPVTIENDWTIWGPIVAKDGNGRPLAYHWTAYDPVATNLEFIRLESAQTTAQAVVIAHRAGMPAQNFVVADAAGQIAWTITGRLPKRFGYDGRLPTSWNFGDRGWKGFLPPDEVPTVIAPASGRLWTANNRALGDPALTLLGDSGYASPPRAAQIRDDLLPLEKAGPRDLLAIQLDDRARFLDRWQKLLLTVLTPEAVAHHPSRAELRQLVEHWGAAASVDSAGYRLVRAFRSRTADLALKPIFAPCVDAMPGFDWGRFHYESALWTMLQEKPLHLLAPQFSNWDALLLAAADQVIADVKQRNLPLAKDTWGLRNTARIMHPFGHMLPSWLGGWLNMPADQLNGDTNMPRVQTPTFGASMRLAVSPGHEAEGLFQMPGGQSGHPLSPYYRAGHEAWVHGEPGPLLPGPTVHTFVLNP
ncbi:MAG: penicillin acylase family protein [Opitutaceae bacterium]